MKDGAASELFTPSAFSGRTAIVTGGGSGIGKAIAETLALHGCAVAVLDLSEGAAREGVAEIKANGGEGLALACDVSDPVSIGRALLGMPRWRPALDFLVNCAGIVIPGTINEADPAAWRKCFDINVHGAFHMCRAAYPLLAASDAPSVVNIASLAGMSAYPGGGGYGPSKAALISLSQQLAVEWGPAGIRVNVVSPATTLTPLVRKLHSETSIAARAAQMPLGRLVLPQEIAQTVCFLLSSAASAITGQALAVDNGFSQSLTSRAAAAAKTS